MKCFILLLFFKIYDMILLAPFCGFDFELLYSSLTPYFESICLSRLPPYSFLSYNDKELVWATSACLHNSTVHGSDKQFGLHIVSVCNR